MALFGLRYDMRAPGYDAAGRQRLYGACLDQVAWGEQAGFVSVLMSEHHGSDDGYLPSMSVLGAAMAARTSTMMISLSAAIVPLHDPIRLAEDLAVLDNLSGGRVEIGVGLGYAVHEFRGFGLPVSHRLSYTDEGLVLAAVRIRG